MSPRIRGLSDDLGKLAAAGAGFRRTDRFSIVAVIAWRKGSRACIAIESKLFRDPKSGGGMPDRGLPNDRLQAGTGGDGYNLLASKRDALRRGNYDPGSPNPTSTLLGRGAKAGATTTQVARSRNQSPTRTLPERVFHTAISEEHLGCLRSISIAN
jgi:hypothetical protein